jgi:hypothetical protein
MVYIPMIDEKSKRALIRAMKRPEGTFVFSAKYDGIYDKSKGRAKLLEVVAGQTVFRLEKDGNLDVNFVFASPGTGTRIAAVNIESLLGNAFLKFFLTWSPEAIGLSIGGADGKELLSSKGCSSTNYDLIVGHDGIITQIGSKGVKIWNPIAVVNGKSVLENSAIKTWQDNLEAIRVLLTGTSPEGYMFESIVSSVSLSILCTGFETYCRKRFLEITGECMEPNYSELEKKFLSKAERERRLIDEYTQSAIEKGHSLAHELVDRRRIDFGNYDNCKDAFCRGYNISFAEDIGVPIQVIQRITEFIKYRHRIVHVSPLITVLNYYEVPLKEPVFSNKALIEIAIKNFGTFIEALHKKTLSLRPP